MIVLGITDPIGDDNAAAILVDGQLIAMVEEERLNRIKHAPSMPALRSVAWCLGQAGCTLDDVDVIALGMEPPEKVFREAASAIARQRVYGRQPYKTMRGEVRNLRLRKAVLSQLQQGLGVQLLGGGDPRVVWVRHHLAHAASAFYLSGFDRANIITLDGTGGAESGLYAVGNGTDIEVLHYVERETSWGSFYEGYTERLGFRPHADEGKVMGLAAYGDARNEIFPYLDLDSRGGFPAYRRRDFEAHMRGIQGRGRSDSPINGYHEHVAAQLQYSLEQVMGRITEVLHDRTGCGDFCLAGGTALNCSSNGKLLRLPHVERLFVQPAASDSGTALGAAVYAYVERTGQRPSTRFDHAYWGPEYSNDEIESALRLAKLDYRVSDDIAADTARLIADDKIVGWFQGRMEVGPRALGARSILASPSNPEMKNDVNRYVKFREPWRPFAPSLLAGAQAEYFGTEHPSPFMILAFEALDDVKDKIPATLHIDDTGRPQTVDAETNPRYWAMLNELNRLTGIPVVLNTSFNVDSEPIVCSPADALATFHKCGLDALVIGDFVLEKSGVRRESERSSSSAAELMG